MPASSLASGFFGQAHGAFGAFAFFVDLIFFRTLDGGAKDDAGVDGGAEIDGGSQGIVSDARRDRFFHTPTGTMFAAAGEDDG